MTDKKKPKGNKAKYVWKIGNVNVDEVIEEVRKVTPCNRKTITNIAVTFYMTGRSPKDVAEDVLSLRQTAKVDDLSDKHVIEDEGIEVLNKEE